MVSDRVGFFCLTSMKRRSEPSTRMVCGSPGLTSSSAPLIPGIGLLSCLTMVVSWLTSSSTADATVAALRNTISTPPSAKRLSMRKPTRGGRLSSKIGLMTRDGARRGERADWRMVRTGPAVSP
jgi:hypothetical protein